MNARTSERTLSSDAEPVGAFRRSGYVLFEHAIRVAASVLLALPVAAVIGGTGVTNLPGGDRALFEPGGLMLLETLRTLLPHVGGLVRSSLLAGFALAALLVVPQGILLVALSRKQQRAVSDVVAEAVRRLPALYSLAALGFLLRCLLFALAVGLAGFARDAVAGGDPRTEDLVFVAVVGLGVLGWIAGGALADLARAAAVDGACAVHAAARVAFAVLRERPHRVAACYALYSLAGVVLVVAAGALVAKLDVSRPEPARFGAVAVLHQMTTLALAFLRASVLAETLSLVSARRLRSAAGRSASSDAPADPSSSPTASGDAAAD
jgi:hypothetical protein